MESDLSAAQKYLDSLINWELTLAQTPNLDPEKVSVGALSGFALKILLGPLMEKTEWKRRTYGDLLVETNRRLLAIAGKGDSHYTTIHWGNPLPIDENEQQVKDQFELDYDLASHETVQVRRGLDPEVETQRIDAEKRATDERDGNVGAMVLRDFIAGRNGQRGVNG
jgi:hypothetical protein